jgi:hypothetical protein
VTRVRGKGRGRTVCIQGIKYMLSYLKTGWKTGGEAMGDPQHSQMILPDSWGKKQKKHECPRASVRRGGRGIIFGCSGEYTGVLKDRSVVNT